MRLTSEPPLIDPVTGIPVPIGQVRVTMDGKIRVTQVTGFASGSLNEEPGTDPNAPGDDDPGLPYGWDVVPQTGPLT